MTSSADIERKTLFDTMERCGWSQHPLANLTEAIHVMDQWRSRLPAGRDHELAGAIVFLLKRAKESDRHRGAIAAATSILEFAEPLGHSAAVRPAVMRATCAKCVSGHRKYVVSALQSLTGDQQHELEVNCSHGHLLGRISAFIDIDEADVVRDSAWRARGQSIRWEDLPAL